MDKCFVIQPFDKGRFDTRYKDVFEPAITKAGLKPYRVDEDPAVKIPIENIERCISDSAICFAEITTNNPNVWYELGYAFAKGKDVVMVCSGERQGAFPFDIQHRHIIKYNSESRSDFDILEKSITEKIMAYLNMSKTIESLSSSPIQDIEGLKGHEIALLIIMMENQLIPGREASMYGLETEMEKLGYRSIAVSVGVMNLEKLGLAERFTYEKWDPDREDFFGCKVTEKGMQWVFDNQDILDLKKPGHDLPF